MGTGVALLASKPASQPGRQLASLLEMLLIDSKECWPEQKGSLMKYEHAFMINERGITLLWSHGELGKVLSHCHAVVVRWSESAKAVRC